MTDQMTKISKKITSANPYPERISGGGGIALLLDIQGFEAYKRLTVSEAARLCSNLSCKFKKKKLNRNSGLNKSEDVNVTPLRCAKSPFKLRLTRVLKQALQSV